ncbi:MAG: DUF1934 domain-containing protein [Clostridia bacterium]|nr:DUF1934 domain-containing protein [Clostridia bacterium]
MNQEPIVKHVRISMTSERYEVAASLFDSVYGDVADLPPQPVSSAEEMLMGIFADDLTNDYFVKPADPAVIRAKKTGEETDAIEKIDLITEGILTVTPDGGFTEEPSYTVAVSYDETELTGMAGARSTVTYRTADRGLVTMLRTGLVSTAMTFKAHHRAICTYDTPYMPFSIGIHALTVDNRLDTEGILKLDYIIEIRGARAERCEMTMKIQEDKSL